jgi:hypothetical protein
MNILSIINLRSSLESCYCSEEKDLQSSTCTISTISTFCKKEEEEEDWVCSHENRDYWGCKGQLNRYEGEAFENLPSRPIACPPPTIPEGFYEHSAAHYREEVEHYNDLTWAMYYRILRSRGGGISNSSVEKKESTMHTYLAPKRTLMKSQHGAIVGDENEPDDKYFENTLSDEVFYLEI